MNTISFAQLGTTSIWVAVRDIDSIIQDVALGRTPEAAVAALGSVSGSPGNGGLAHAVAGRYLAGGDFSDLACVEAGSSFRRDVWAALRRVPFGVTLTYGELAQCAGRPNAIRAAATACASNRLALIVPCHRVIGADGKSGQYRWGPDIKASLIAMETPAFDQMQRIRQKAEARARDEADLAAGRVTPEELRRRNGFFSSIDVSKLKIVAIGGKPISS